MFRTAALVMAAGVALSPAVVAAPQPPRPRVEQVMRLAHAVEDSARDVRAEARRGNGRLSLSEVRALRRLDLLVSRAGAFHAAVERRPLAWSTGEELDALLVARERAADAFGGLRPSRRARQEFQQLSVLMDQLAHRYESLVMARDHRRPRHGERYDRDGR